MKNNILFVLLFFLIPIIINGQTQEATTTDGKKVFLFTDGTWKYAEEVATLDGKKIILNADGTWKYAENKKVVPEAEEQRLEKIEADRSIREEMEAVRNLKEAEELERKRIQAEQKRQADIMNRSRDALANSETRGESSGLGNQGISYDLGGRGFQSLPKPNYDYQDEGKVVVEVSVDRSGKVTQVVPGSKGSTTLDEYLLKVAKEAALKARFEPKSDAPALQKGTITYNFIIR